jgi:hypothetical protein
MSELRHAYIGAPPRALEIPILLWSLGLSALWGENTQWTQELVTMNRLSRNESPERRRHIIPDEAFRVLLVHLLRFDQQVLQA